MLAAVTLTLKSQQLGWLLVNPVSFLCPPPAPLSSSLVPHTGLCPPSPLVLRAGWGSATEVPGLAAARFSWEFRELGQATQPCLSVPTCGIGHSPSYLTEGYCEDW